MNNALRLGLTKKSEAVKRKRIIIVCVVCIVTVFCGCEAEGNVPDSLSRDAYKAEMEVQRLRADIGDSILWDSLDRSTDLIKK